MLCELINFGKRYFGALRHKSIVNLRKMEQELSFFSIIDFRRPEYRLIKHVDVNLKNSATGWRAQTSLC
jgi:hypothetical protein